MKNFVLKKDSHVVDNEYIFYIEKVLELRSA